MVLLKVTSEPVFVASSQVRSSAAEVFAWTTAFVCSICILTVCGSVAVAEGSRSRRDLPLRRHRHARRPEAKLQVRTTCSLACNAWRAAMPDEYGQGGAVHKKS